MSSERRPCDQRRRQGLRREHRLRRRSDFQRCYRHGRRRHGSLAFLCFHPNAEAAPRLGITAGRKVGISVVRHRLKRRVREIFRRFEGRETLPCVDLVVHLKPAAAEAGFASLRAEVETLLQGTLGSRSKY